MITLNFKSFAEMITKLPDNKSCRQYLEQKRWNGNPTCPYCVNNFYELDNS